MNVKYGLLLGALVAPMALADGMDGSVGLGYRQYDPASSRAPEAEALDGYLAAQYGGFGFEATTSGTDGLTTGIVAAHYDFADRMDVENWNYGIVIGKSFGNLDTEFVGLEGGYKGDALSASLRGTYWVDTVASDGWRADLDLGYQFQASWSVYFLYSHYEFDGGDFLSDDYQTGVRYHLGDAARIELGYGEVHPQTVSTGQQMIWSQYSLGLYYDFGKGANYERMRPVFASAKIK